MSRTSLRRLATVVTAAAAVAVVAASPASAGSMFFSKASGTVASSTWLEVGELPASTGALGNFHYGDIWVDDIGNGRPQVFGTVYDVLCEDGAIPYNPGAGGHGEEPPVDGPCELVGLRFIEGGKVKFTVDRKLTKATLTGTLAVGSGHGETPSGTPPVNITWTGIGNTYTSRESGTSTDEYGTFSYRYTFTGRNAVVGAGSRIGPMVFDDETGESSQSQLGKYRSSDRGRA